MTPADGQVHYLRLKTTHEVLAQVGLVEDVTASTLERLRIEHDRDYDTLTGLYNRQAFQRECEALFLHPENLRHAAFLMLDLDNLKQTNDTYGHDYGDQYIRQTGLCFASHTPDCTLCSRISGDEFNVFFYGYDSQDEIRTVIEQLRDEFSQKVIHLPDGQELFISISGGIAWYPEDASDPTTLKKYADFAMYQVKHSKKGRLGEFDLGTYNNEIYSLQSKKEFDRLIREELIHYQFQPIVSCVTGEAIAYEALMRVDLPTISSPDTVLKMARAEGRLHDIERITIFKASEAYLALLRDKLVRNSDLLFLNSIASQHMTEEENREFANRFSMLQKNIVIEITEEEALDHHSLEVNAAHLVLPACLRLTITAAATAMISVCWNSPRSLLRSISRSFETFILIRINSRLSPILFPTPTKETCVLSQKVWKHRRSFPKYWSLALIICRAIFLPVRQRFLRRSMKLQYV